MPLRTGVFIGAAAFGVALFAGCAVQVPERDYGPTFGDQGGSWDIALSAPEAAAHDLAQWPGLAPEYARLDGKLAVGGSQVSYPLDQWPAEPTPTLDRRGYILISRNPATVTYFRRR
jgi:hypothetical protein